MKKNIFAVIVAVLMVHTGTGQLHGAQTHTLESIYATTITPADASVVAPSKTVYDYLYDLNNGQKTEAQDLLLSKTKQSVVHIEPGVHCESLAQGEPVFLFSASFLPEPVKTPGKLHFYWPGAPGRALYSAGYYFSNKALSGTCIAFEYPDTLTTLNIAQELDQKCLNTVTDEVIEQGHPFVLFGKCRGATNILTLLTKKPKEYLEKNVRAAIIESAPLSLKHICEQTMRALPVLNWFYWLSDKKTTAALYALFRLVLTNHRYEESTILNNLSNIPQDMPILIAHVLKDTVVFDQDIKTLLQKLLETGHTCVHLLLFDDTKLDHYTISSAPAYPLAVNAFLKRYQLPHLENLATQGAHIMPAVTVPLACPSDMSEQAYIEQIWQTCVVNPDGSSAHHKISKSTPEILTSLSHQGIS